MDAVELSMKNEPINGNGGARKPFPKWLKKRVQAGNLGEPVRELLQSLQLKTVCQGAHCPNQCECFAKGTATFMVLGAVCSRNCRFCAVGSGQPAAPDDDEPQRLAQAVSTLGLRHVVITSVTRDDLPDGGAGHFARTISAVREQCDAVIEVLTPDFRGDTDAVDAVLDADPDIFNHNLETIARLYPKVRPQASYPQSLRVLQYIKQNGGDVFTKSGIMVGLGETREEVLLACRDLRGVGCDILTIGQYLRPSTQHIPIERFVPPDEFREYRREAEALGFLSVAAGPFVRSSYNAREVFEAAENKHSHK
jgi:lipoic acid synthetase